jgi:1-acyl-sn-glycerol-3-phosphate acyltransferase
MQKIFIEKPYRFVPPMMLDWLAKLMNNRLVHTPLLRFTESIVSVESRGVDRLKKSIDDGHAVMMIPNHPRTSDPVVMYDLLRLVGKPMFAMASWHLFNHGWFNRAVIRLYGGYSINREGLDKTSISFSVSALEKNLRPLLMFPEGATSRTNDSLMPFLDGPSFIARTAARRRFKKGLKTVIHPIAIRYVFVGDFDKEFSSIMNSIGNEIGVRIAPSGSPVDRIQSSLEHLVERKEQEFEVEPDDSLCPFERRQRLAESVLATAEIRCFGQPSRESITNRVRNIRARVFPEILDAPELSDQDRAIRWRDLERTYLAWQMASYPQDYLVGAPSTDRVLEIAGKIQEDLTDEPRKCGPQRAIIECCDAIEVPTTKHRGPEADPLVKQIEEQLLVKLNRPATECSLP